jgi:hypothetical protein
MEQDNTDICIIVGTVYLYFDIMCATIEQARLLESMVDPGNFIHFEDYELQFIPPGLLWECSRAITEYPPENFL